MNPDAVGLLSVDDCFYDRTYEHESNLARDVWARQDRSARRCELLLDWSKGALLGLILLSIAVAVFVLAREWWDMTHPRPQPEVWQVERRIRNCPDGSVVMEVR